MQILKKIQNIATGLFLSCCFLFIAVGSPAQTDSLRKLYNNARQDSTRIKLLLELGKTFKNTIPDSAVYYYNKASDIALSTRNDRYAAIALRELASVYKAQGAYRKAMDYYLKAVAYFQKNADKNGMAQCYNGMGIIYSDLSTYDKSIEYYMKSLKIKQELNDRKGIAACYNNIGILYTYQSKYDKAIENYQKALNISFELKDEKTVSDCYVNIGNACCEKKEYNKAMDYYNKSLAIKEQLDDKKGMSKCYTGIGSVLDEQGKYDNALEYYFKSLKIKEELGDKNGMSNVYGNIALLYIKRKNNKEAIVYAEKSLALAKEIGELFIQRLDYETLAEAYRNSGNYKQAYEYYTLYKQANDSIFNDESNRNLTEMQAKYEIREMGNELLLKDKELEIKQFKISRMKYILYILLLAVILILFAAFVVIRKNRIESQLKNIQIEQRLLQSQMNPHFFYNALSVIQNVINQKRNDFAVLYLSSFARLTRMIFENSRHEAIPLDEEINMLDLYLELQAARFEQKFSYKINIDENIDTELVTIPPMLSQPFIENAIEHGIIHKEGKGNINISFKTKGDMLVFEITDDGVGREKSMELKKETKGKKHVSRATQITQERIENINKSMKKKIRLEIIDLKDENGNATGTTVRFMIPGR